MFQSAGSNIPDCRPLESPPIYSNSAYLGNISKVCSLYCHERVYVANAAYPLPKPDCAVEHDATSLIW